MGNRILGNNKSSIMKKIKEVEKSLQKNKIKIRITRFFALKQDKDLMRKTAQLIQNAQDNLNKMYQSLFKDRPITEF